MAQLKDLIVAGSSRFLGNVYFEDSVTLNDTLILAKSTDLSGTADNRPALIVGGLPAAAHIEFDGDEIQAKASATQVGPLYINKDGGNTNIGSSVVIASDSGAATSTTGAIRITGGISASNTSYFGGALNVSGLATFSGYVRTAKGEAATSATSGDIRVDGGIGVAKASYFGSSVTVNGNLTVKGNTVLGNAESDTITIKGKTSITGPVTITGNTTHNGIVYFANGTTYYINNSGTGVLNELTMLNNIYFGQNKTYYFTNAGTGYVNALTTNGAVKMNGGTDSSSTSSGQLVVAGGVGISKQLYTGGTHHADGGVQLPHNKSLIQIQQLTSNYTTAIKWLQNGVSEKTYDPHIGHYNTAEIDTGIAENNPDLGAIILVPYSTDNSPWNGNDGLYISKKRIKWNNLVTLNSSRELHPAVDKTGSLGTSNYRWGNLYINILNAAGNATISGNLTANGTLSVVGTSTLTGKLTANGGIATTSITASGTVAITQNLAVAGNTSLGGETSDKIEIIGVTTVSGPLNVTGNVGIVGNTSHNGIVYFANGTTYYINNSATGNLNALTLNSTTDSTATTNGALIVKGGVGIAKQLRVAGNTTLSGTLTVTGATTLNNTTDSSSTSTGALIVKGGVGIAKQLRVGGNTTLTGNLTVNSGTVTIHKDTSIANDYPAKLTFSVKQTDNNITTASAYIAVYDDHDTSTYGTNMVITSPSALIIGGGESASAFYTNVVKGTASEVTYITSDDNIQFFTNCNTIGSRTGVNLDTSRQFYPILSAAGSAGSLGTNNYYWANAYLGTTHFKSGHIYLEGSNTSSTTGNTTQLVFGTSSTNHVVLSANNNALVINPTTSTTTNQIVLYLDTQSLFPSGINATAASTFGNAVSVGGALTFTGTTDGTSQIHFNRTNNPSYFTCGTGGYYCFVPNGQSAGTAASDLTIANGAVYPGTTNVTTLGKSDYKWKNVYATTFTGAMSTSISINGKSYNGSQDINVGTIGVAYGGTGKTSLDSGKVLIGAGTSAVTLRSITNNTTKTAVTASTNLITANTLYYHSGNSNLTTVGTISSGTWQGTSIKVGYGGTGTTTAPTQGGIIYGSSTSAYGCTAAGTSGYLLQSNGTSAPSWINATNTNTASTIVKRDSSGNFSAGTITATLDGNASTSSRWKTAIVFDGMSLRGDAARYSYGTCSTAAATAAKTVTCAGFVLVTGSEITVKFTVTNTAKNPTLNVNSTGAKAIYYNGAAITASYLAANKTYTFRYNGTQYDLVGDINVPVDTSYKDAVQCTTAGGTAAKVGKASYYNLSNNRYFFVMMANANTYAGAITLNINSSGAKTIYINGSISSSSNYTLPAGLYHVYYNGSYYYFRTNSTYLDGCFTRSYINTTTSNTKYYIVGASGTGDQSLYRAYNSSGSKNTTGVYFNGSTGVLYGAAWNDYAEFRQCKELFNPGNVVFENGDDTLSISTRRMQRGCSIISDTFGFAIGETDQAKCPIAVSGRVLAYPYESLDEFRNHIGYAVCSGPNGTVSIMTEEEERNYPTCIIGTISAVPEYSIWGPNNIKVNNRVWIKIK